MKNGMESLEGLVVVEERLVVKMMKSQTSTNMMRYINGNMATGNPDSEGSMMVITVIQSME